MGVYGDLLLRGATTSDISYWTGVMQRGASRQTVAQLIVQSAEYRQLQGNAWVQGLYHRLLSRTGSATDLTYWTYQLLTGASQETVLVNILLSDEYYLRSAAIS